MTAVTYALQMKSNSLPKTVDRLAQRCAEGPPGNYRCSGSRSFFDHPRVLSQSLVNACRIG